MCLLFAWLLIKVQCAQCHGYTYVLLAAFFFSSFFRFLMARTCTNRQTEQRVRSEVGLFVFISWTRQWQWRHQQHHCWAVTYARRFSISRCFWNVRRLRTHQSRVGSSQAYGARETVASWYDNYCLFFNALSGTFDSISLALALSVPRALTDQLAIL